MMFTIDERETRGDLFVYVRGSYAFQSEDGPRGSPCVLMGTETILCAPFVSVV